MNCIYYEQVRLYSSAKFDEELQTLDQEGISWAVRWYLIQRSHNIRIRNLIKIIAVAIYQVDQVDFWYRLHAQTYWIELENKLD